jgi:hypothetical protein
MSKLNVKRRIKTVHLWVKAILGLREKNLASKKQAARNDKFLALRYYLPND